jgi:hypothetical protein
LSLDQFSGGRSAELTRAIGLTQSLSHGRGVVRGRFTQKQFETVVELAYLQGYLAWESFLEETFILYMVGKRAPNGYRPKCYVQPTSRGHALDFNLGEQRYADWTAADRVVQRAQRFFKNGEPFATPLQSMGRVPDDMKILRNAIAHRSEGTNSRFQSVVRNELGFYAHGLTVGGFLDSGVPTAAPGLRYLDYYFENLLQAARNIVPS